MRSLITNTKNLEEKDMKKVSPKAKNNRKFKWYP